MDFAARTRDRDVSPRGTVGVAPALALVLLTLTVTVPAVPTVGQASRSRLFPVVQHEKTGFIDGRGRLVIPPQFSDPSVFSEGLAAVKVGDVWGYVDEAGKVVVAPRFEWAAPFSEGLAVVQARGAYGYVDRAGRLAVEPRFAAVLRPARP
jgi:hypothetical protein